MHLLNTVNVFNAHLCVAFQHVKKTNLCNPREGFFLFWMKLLKIMIPHFFSRFTFNCEFIYLNKKNPNLLWMHYSSNTEKK